MRQPFGSLSAAFILIQLLFFTPLRDCQAQVRRDQRVTIRGRITTVATGALRVATLQGELSVRLPENVRVNGVVPAALTDITAGTYVGTTAVRQPNGDLTALEVHIFPESSRGRGEGHRPWDLQRGSTMTNGNVENVEQVSVENVRGPMLTLRYKGGEQKVFVHPGTPIVKSVRADRTALVPGAGVFIPAVEGREGTLTATRITVGIGGIMPPM